MAPKLVVSRWPVTVAAGKVSPVLAMLEVSRNGREDGGRLEEVKVTVAGRNRLNKRV